MCISVCLCSWAVYVSEKLFMQSQNRESSYFSTSSSHSEAAAILHVDSYRLSLTSVAATPEMVPQNRQYWTDVAGNSNTGVTIHM